MLFRTHYSSWAEILKIITPGDKSLIVSIIALSIISFVTVNHLSQPGEFLVIEVEGKVLSKLNLNEEQELAVVGPIGNTIVKIDRGKAQVIHSDCPEKICVKTGKISRAGEIIVCVPNKVVVRINGRRKNHFDVITQ